MAQANLFEFCVGSVAIALTIFLLTISFKIGTNVTVECPKPPASAASAVLT